MRENKLKTFMMVLISLMVVIVLYTIAVCSIFYRKIDMPIMVAVPSDYNKVYNQLVREYDYDMEYERGKEQYKNMIEEQLGLKAYMYLEKSICIDYDGYMIAGIRLMVVDKDLSLYDYCVVFAHESLHFTKFSSNDTYINYEVFKFLYENEDEELKNIGIDFAIRQLAGKYGGRYNCSSYIVNYFVSRHR